jgi:glutamate N-acetyltransferase/amino-acid N-acetyltransferase
VTDGASFFRSRWVERPDHVRELEPSSLPAGFRAAGVAAGIKPDGLDVGVLVSDAEGTTSAARFTTNARAGAPVIVSREADLARLRAVAVNSGCSNVGDGERGLATARATQAAVAGDLARDAEGFARAILTSDHGPKRACLEVELDAGPVRLAAQAKGAGMISPRFATMLCFVETDASLSPETLDLLIGVCVKRSFDRISVDGQLSTSDTVFAFAGGAAGVRVEPETSDELRLGEAMDALLRQLALEIVRDGEGAGRVGRLLVTGAPGAVEPVARAVADSPLVKTALHGADPNFGRILQAAGQAWPVGTPFVVDLEIEGRQVVSAGDAIDLGDGELRELVAAVRGEEVEFALTLPGEGGEAEVFFSDLSEAYVRFNAEYTS